MVPVQYTEGQEAYAADLGLQDNPYPEDPNNADSNWAWWQKGWLAADQADQVEQAYLKPEDDE